MNIRLKKINQKGIFIIESLIALLVFLIGILAILKYQGENIIATTQSQNRITATFLADGLLGTMWLNKNHLAEFSDGSHEEYQHWLTQVSTTLPGIDTTANSATAPQITISTNANKISNISIILKWHTPGMGISSYVLNSTIY
jgi:hypothetical protein